MNSRRVNRKRVHFLFPIFLCILSFGPVRAEAGIDAAGLVLKKIIEAKVYPRSECLSALEEESSEGWTSVALREKHNKQCGGDPEVAPVIDRFRLHSKTGKIQHYNPLDDEYESFEKFLSGLKSR